MTERQNRAGILLRQIEHQRRERLRPVFLQMGLTLGQGQPCILNCLLEKDGVTQTHLAQLCGIDAATISRALDKLEQSGWICRQQDPDSRRCYRIVLTGAGVKRPAWCARPCARWTSTPGTAFRSRRWKHCWPPSSG